MAWSNAFPPLNDRRSRARKLALVVDGDVVSRMETRLFLEMQGYEAVELGDGMEAIDLMDLQHPPCDLVVLNDEMPLLSGPETLHALRVFQPGLRALICTSKGKRIDTTPPPDKSVFLERPFTLQDLSMALARLYAIPTSYQGPERRRSVRQASPL
jgi:CheY-like chemotaxis protein